MSKNRFINTKFWSDTWIIELEPLERYLFLYLLTNEHTNIAGIYELPLRIMSFETGIEKEKLTKILKKFIGKVHYFNSWVFLVNFEKHQKVRGSQKILQGIENIKNAVPSEILQKIEKLKIPYEYPMDTLSVDYGYSSNYSDSDSDSDMDTKIDTPSIPHKLTKTHQNTKFTSPSLQEISDYITSMEFELDPADFFDKQEACGWTLKNGKRIKDWKAVVRTWERNRKKWSQDTEDPIMAIIKNYMGKKDGVFYRTYYKDYPLVLILSDINDFGGEQENLYCKYTTQFLKDTETINYLKQNPYVPHV